MPDREKVIKAIEEAFDLVHSDFIGTDDFNEKEWEQNKADALTLLKEQEAVEPRVSSVEQRCGNCNKVIEMDGWKTCPWCGKRINWESWWSKNGNR